MKQILAMKIRTIKKLLKQYPPIIEVHVSHPLNSDQVDNLMESLNNSGMPKEWLKILQISGYNKVNIISPVTTNISFYKKSIERITKQLHEQVS